jgi:hypothetical protein
MLRRLRPLQQGNAATSEDESSSTTKYGKRRESRRRESPRAKGPRAKGPRTKDPKAKGQEPRKPRAKGPSAEDLRAKGQKPRKPMMLHTMDSYQKKEGQQHRAVRGANSARKRHLPLQVTSPDRLLLQGAFRATTDAHHHADCL